MEKSEEINAYYATEHPFKAGVGLLRDLAKKTQATETYKWNVPVYTIGGKNVFWISRFKNHFALGFFNGVFLQDPKGVLMNAQEGKTKAMRHWKFKSDTEIDNQGVLAYMKEALEKQEKGFK